MNKRYMDFVPVSVTHGVVRDDAGVEQKSKLALEKTRVKTETMHENKVENEPEFGVIKERKPRVVKASVEKRPLSRPTSESKVKSEEAIAKKQAEEKIYQSAVKKADKIAEEKPPKKQTEVKAHFVNTEKVTKRPLSKNVYRKKVVEPEEEPSKEITIITSEKKDSRIGIVVAVIITIILGATAGTVAFLLLPR